MKDDMKEDQQEPLYHHHRKATAFARQKFTKPTAYFFILLLLSYILGYFSAPSGRSSPCSPTQLMSSDNAAAAGGGLDDHYRFATRCSNDPVPSNLVRQMLLDRLFDGVSPYDNFPPAHVSPFLREKRIKGWDSYNSVFETLIRRVRPKVIIEVGTFLGASATHMAELASGLGLGTQIICIDDFRGQPWGRHHQEVVEEEGDIPMINGDLLLMYQFMQNVVHENATESVLFLPFSSWITLDVLCRWGVFADLIEVDAGHDFHSAWVDINLAYKLLRPGGVLFGHDYFLPLDNKGVKRAVDLFARVNGLRVQIDGEHWVIDSS
ncbi:uncharacterized protein LOC132313916 [Cornus florida]|uniref:uncharacterized protein LOC132313916 n=1 Tax=Cornus florida TaxID=4283 RepID=UPI00289BF841|nr:uncharacterized protein LOC132313916 [Cornus florida]